jgi:hypothetical protein
MHRLIMCFVALIGLSACAADSVYAPQDAVDAVRFVAEPPTSITLYTVINNRSNSGAHSGLLINASQQVMFDPAGTWHHPRIPERNDVHYGITPQIVNFYIDYHARETFRVLEQRIVVSPQVAELVKQRAEAYGAVPKAQCSNSVSSILSGVPGFESLGTTWFPKKLSDAFGKLPGVTSRTITDDSADKNHGVLLIQASEATQ